MTTLAICLAAGCSNEIGLYTDPEKPINTIVGEEFIISFQLDPPGCHWKERHDKDMLYLIEETYGPVEKGSNSVTFAGTQYFRYKSLKSGITYVTLSQLRLNEPDIAVEKVYEVNILVPHSSFYPASAVRPNWEYVVRIFFQFSESTSLMQV